MVTLVTSEENITTARKKSPQNSRQKLCRTAIVSQEAAHMLAYACSEWGLGAEVWAVSSVLMEKTRV